METRGFQDRGGLGGQVDREGYLVRSSKWFRRRARRSRCERVMIYLKGGQRTTTRLSRISEKATNVNVKDGVISSDHSRCEECYYNLPRYMSSAGSVETLACHRCRRNTL